MSNEENVILCAGCGRDLSDTNDPNDPNCLKWENTYALDIALPEGTEVIAPADG